MNSKMMCLACNNKINYESEALICVVCGGHYHYSCLLMTTTDYQRNIHDLKRKWRCESCCNVSQRRRGDDTPVTPLSTKMLQSPPMADISMTCDESVLTLGGQDLDGTAGGGNVSACPSTGGQVDFSPMVAMFEKLDAKLDSVQSSISKEITQLKQDFSQKTDLLISQYKTLSGKVATLEDENAKLREELGLLKTKVSTSSDGLSLSNAISNLQMDINDRDQEALINDLEIAGIPEFGDESALHIVSTIATKLGVEVDIRDVVSAYRVGSVRGRGAGVDENTQSAQPRRMVVRFTRRSVRDAFLRAARVRRSIRTSDMGLPSHTQRQIHINERLTKVNRILFAKARAEGAAQGWRFVWTRNGRIFARYSATMDSQVYRIRSEKDLNCIFNKASVENSK